MDAIIKENLAMVLFYYIDVVVVRNRCGGFSGGTMDALSLGLSFNWKFLDGGQDYLNLSLDYSKIMENLWAACGSEWSGAEIRR